MCWGGGSRVLVVINGGLIAVWWEGNWRGVVAYTYIPSFGGQGYGDIVSREKGIRTSSRVGIG